MNSVVLFFHMICVTRFVVLHSGILHIWCIFLIRLASFIEVSLYAYVFRRL